MRKLIILVLLIGLSFAQKPTQRISQNTDWLRITDTNGDEYDYTRDQFFNPGFDIGSIYDSGSYTIRIVDVFTEIGASAHKSINVDLAYTPVATGAAAPIGIASKVTMTTGMTRNSASSNYQGLAWGLQGQIHTLTGSTYAGETATDPGMILAGLRGVITDAGTSTYTNGTFTGAYLESQVSQDVTTGDFRHFLLWCRNQGSGTATPITAAIYIDEGDAWTNTILTGIDINNTVKGMDIMATTTGIDFSSSMTQEIIGQNDEIMSNANDGEWDFGIAKIATTGSGRGTDQYEFVFDVTNRSGGIFPNGGPYKTYIYNVEVDREADEDATGDSRDVMFKGVYRNYGQNAAGLHVQGIGTSVRNESGGTLGSMKGGEFGVNQKSGATVDAQMYGLTATVENYGTPGSVIAAGVFDIRNEGTNATAEYGIHVTNTNNSQADAADAAIYVDDSGANIGWGYGLDMSGATIQTADIKLSDGSEIGATTNGSTLNTATGVTNVNYASALNRTVVTLTAHAMDITDTGGANGGHGALKILDFPEGYIRIEGVIGDIAITSKSGGVSATAVFDMAMGTVTTDVGQATLAGTNVDIVAKVDGDLVGSADTIDLVDTTTQDEDGHSGSTDVWLCVAVEDASISSTGTMVMSGTIVITWYNLGDY